MAVDEPEQLWQKFASTKAADDFIQSWLALLCGIIPGNLHGVVVLGPPDTGPFVPKAFWPSGEAAGPGIAGVAEQALAERQPVALKLSPDPGAAQRGIRSHGLAFPVEVDGHLHGVVALEISSRPEEQLQWVLRQLQWGIAWLEVLIRREAQTEVEGVQDRLMSVLDLIATVLEEDSFEAAARSLVTDLALRLNCDRVSLGVLRKGYVSVIALSHSAEFGKRMNLIHAIGAAMDEAVDQKSVLAYPPGPDGAILVVRDHERLAREHGNDSILTVPFAGTEDFVGALTLERAGQLPFDDDTVELCQSVTAVLSRILEAKRLNDRPLRRRLMDALRDQAHKLFGPRHVTRKLIAAVGLLAVLFLSFASGDYRVTATSTLEGAVRRTLAAPFDGYIAEAAHRAGDVVQAQTALATLDDRDLRLERLKWASQHAQYSKQYQEAVAAHDRARAQITQAQFEQSRAQMVLIEEQLSRATIRAPFDGIVVRGDLSQSLGSAVKRGDTLFEITPLDSYRVVVQVDEAEIADVRAGQTGSLVLASISDQVFEFVVSNVTPVTTSREGRNYFRVEGLLKRAPERLRPGMEGVGKIDVEERKLIWIWTHRLVNWMRLFLWSWWP